MTIFSRVVRYIRNNEKMTMKRTILILLSMMTLMPAVLHAQDRESLYTGWGLGFQLGAGGMTPTGSLADEFKGCALFTGGLNAEYNRLRFKADVTYSQPSFKTETPYGERDEQQRNLQLNGTASTTSLGVGFQLGYTVWSQGKVSVTPNVGVNFNRLNWDMNTIKWEKNDEGEEQPLIDKVTDVHESTTGFTASVDIDIKIGGKFVDMGEGSHYTSSLRISPFITHAGYGNLSPSIKGNWVGVTLSYAGLFRLMSH